jgi:hypothetical protein
LLPLSLWSLPQLQQALLSQVRQALLLLLLPPVLLRLPPQPAAAAHLQVA